MKLEEVLRIKTSYETFYNNKIIDAMFNLGRLFQNDTMDYLSILEEVKNGNSQLVDIREQAEWDQNHFVGALHLPLSGLYRGEGIENLKEVQAQKKKIYRHCYSGGRVSMGKKILEGFGFKDINTLPIHMNTLIQHGFQLIH